MSTEVGTANIESACRHFSALKDRMGKEASDELQWYEHSDKQGCHYSSITQDNYLRLFYRVIWTSGFKAKIVFEKEDAYFSVVHEQLLQDGVYQAANEKTFLEAVAPVLGGHAENRKNRAFVSLLRRVHDLGWDEFKNQYITPGPGVEERLRTLDMIGPKTVKLLLNQTGMIDVAKDDLWVTRFAEGHGFQDPHECVRQISERLGDAQTTIDAVLFWSGRTHGLRHDRD